MNDDVYPDVPMPELPEFKTEDEYNEFFGYAPDVPLTIDYQTLERYQNRGGTVLGDEVGTDGAKAVEAALDEYDNDGLLYIVMGHKLNGSMWPTFIVLDGEVYRLEKALEE